RFPGSYAARAVRCFQQALRFRTAEVAPLECRQTHRALAELHFRAGEWQAAWDASRAAIDAGERLYRAGLSEESRAAEMAENVALYRNAAFALVQLGGPGKDTEALLLWEQGKARLLREALRLGVPRPDGLPDELWQDFRTAGADLRTAQTATTDWT